MPPVGRMLYDVHKKAQSPIAFEGQRRLGALYDIEREIDELPPERRRSVIRAERTVPLPADLRLWMEPSASGGRGRTSRPKHCNMPSALEGTRPVTTDGRLAIDNNAAERALQGIAVTRKNHLFLGSDEGGESAAIIYTALEIARLNGINPETWLLTSSSK